jgi:hypothetical protein
MDYSTGQIKWKWSVGSTTETPFGNWAFSYDLAIADGKLYVGSVEHSPTQPLTRGNRLSCIDAFTGKSIWNVSGTFNNIYAGSQAIADGYLVTQNTNDGKMYCFGKGKTETTVSIQDDVVAKGNSVLIKGTVMDMSPAQEGTPAIADEYMSEWMNYVHMQRPEPMTSPTDDNWGTAVDVTGVPVELRVVHLNGSVEWISTVSSDGYGMFGHEWSPPEEGLYKIMATFAGSDSYWPSTEETLLSVGPAPEPSVPVEPEPLPPPAEAPFITTEVAIIIAVAVVAVIGVAAFWILRKRQ